jgi:DNA-binding response OmpR family regulator
MPRAEHILIVDDDAEIRTLLRDYLERNGLRATAVGDGRTMRAALEAGRYDLVVLDLMLPGEDGLTLCRELRAKSSLPVIMLTARGEDTDRIVGLEMGADDYLAKPFNPRELSARVRAVLRRQAEAKALAAQVSELQSIVADEPQAGERSGDEPGGAATWARDRELCFDPARRRAWFRGQPLELRPKEYDLLCFLAQHRGQVFTREVLLSHVWGYDSDIDQRTVDVHVRRLRVKLAAIAPEVEVILTEWGVGYRLAGEV